MNGILQSIIDNKRREVDAMLPLAAALPSPPRCSRPSMARALSASPTGIIAEFKRRSPSKGDIHPKALVSEVLPAYQAAGATACSVLTDTPFFGGALTDLALAARCCSLPLLRKEFVVDESQIADAARCGASAVLLIAAVLSPALIARFTACAHALGLEVLLEVHALAELDKCDPAAVDMLGVNNRNLDTFAVDPMLSLKVAQALPDGPVKVAESGLSSMAEVLALRSAGYRGFLIGESFMKHPRPGDALARFLAGS